jgi:hypothetical protein
MAPPVLDGLQIEEDIAFQRRSWRVQRVAWAVMALILLAGLLGVFGSGPLSQATASMPGVLAVEYQRFARYDTPDTLSIRLEPAATGGPAVRVGLDRAYLDHSKIDSMVPPPARVHGAGDRLVYEFPIAEPGRPLTITLALEPQQIGIVHGRVTLERDGGVETVSFRQLVYP